MWNASNFFMRYALRVSRSTNLSLSLLMLGNRANHEKFSLSPDNFALIADFFDRSSYFHPVRNLVILSQLSPYGRIIFPQILC